MNTKNIPRVVASCLVLVGLFSPTSAAYLDSYNDYRDGSTYNSNLRNDNYRYDNYRYNDTRYISSDLRSKNLNYKYNNLPYTTGKSRNYIPSTICFNKKIYNNQNTHNNSYYDNNRYSNNSYYNNNRNYNTYRTIVVCYNRAYNTVPTRNNYNSNFY